MGDKPGIDINTALGQLPADVITRITDMCDGHTILPVAALVDAGMPAHLAERLARTWRSDGSPKGTIHVRDRPVEQMHGIYGLALLQRLAAALGVSYVPALGRGSEAQRIHQAIHRHLGRGDAGSPGPP